jgi:hypothetical protein
MIGFGLTTAVGVIALSYGVMWYRGETCSDDEDDANEVFD